MNTTKRKIYNWPNSFWKLALMLLFISLQSVLHAQSLFSAPEIKAEASIDTNSIMVGEQTHIHLRITSPKNILIHWPIIEDTLSKNVEVIRNSSVDTIFINDKDLITLNQTITISSFDSGLFVIPPFYFHFGAHDSIQELIKSEALILEVKNVQVDLNKEIKDIKPILDEPLTFKEILPYILIALGIILAIILIIYIVRRRKQNKPLFSMPQKPQIPAHIVALQKLNTLTEKKLWQTGSSKEFYSELTDIIREYMEGQFHFGALEMISDEILQELKNHDLNDDLYIETRNTLQSADLVKFAKIEPLADENNKALKWGYWFVNTTMPEEQNTEEQKENKTDVKPVKPAQS
ncbi:MAG: hypothetical protein KAG64_02630 [Bacteroidales bacterium]|nr:hypothetical protein [Bacteroidales bacterium]